MHVLGERVGLIEQASVGASGESGGGEILVGGDYRGENPEVKNAEATYIGQSATIRADALTDCDGGRIIVWSTEATRVYGQISATGGADAGDGGFVETSGHYLDVTTAPTVDAANGSGGTWLLDPFNLAVVAGVTCNVLGCPAGPNFTADVTNSQVGVGVIEPLLDVGGTTVILDTGGGGAEDGDVSFDASLTKNGAGTSTLQVNADGDVIVGNPITSTGGPLNINFLADRNTDAVGSVSVTSQIDTNGGTVDLSAPTDAVLSGATITDSTLTASGVGDLSASGSVTTLDGVNVAGSNQLVNAGSGTIRATGGTANTLNAEITNTRLVDLIAGLVVTNAGRTFTHDGGNVNISAGQTLTVNGGSFAWNAGFLTGTATSAINLAGGAALGIGGTGAKTLDGLTLTTSGGNISGTGSVTLQSGTLQDTATLTVDNGAAVNVNGGTLDVDILAINGTVSLNSGTLTTTTGINVGNTGVFNLNTGGVFTPGTFNNNGVVNINNAAAVLNLTQNGAYGSTFSVVGGAELLFTSGTHTFNGGCTVQGAGTTTLAGASWGGTGTVTLNTDFDWNSGTMLAGGGTIANQGMTIGGAVTLNRDLTNDGVTTWSPAFNMSGSGTFINENVLRGTGTIGTSVTNNGEIRPGTSPGVLNITGDLMLGSSSVVTAELGGTKPPGPTPPTNFDIIAVTGTADLDGTLNVVLFGGFIGAPGNSFDIITAGVVANDFVTVNTPATHTFSSTNLGALYQLLLLGLSLGEPLGVGEILGSDEIVILEQNLAALFTQFAISEQEEALRKVVPAVKCQ